jgi:pyrroloquinoline quinone biosynthesis protein B
MENPGRERNKTMVRSLLLSLFLTSCLSSPLSAPLLPAEKPSWTHKGKIDRQKTSTRITNNETRFSLFVLGIGQDGGLPHVGCNQSCCVEAREKGLERYPVSLGLFDNKSKKLILIEASPRVEAQISLFHKLVARSQKPRKPIDGIFLTHAHIGHYLGLAQFGREVASTHNIPTYVGPRMADFLRTNGPWNQLVKLKQIQLRTLKPGTPVQVFPGLHILPILVPHRDEFSETFAFKIIGPNRTVLFVPDIDRWDRHQKLLAHLLESIDFAYLDGTFFDGRELPGRNILEVPHPPIVLSMKLLQNEARKHPGSIRFLHLNHSNPLFQDKNLQKALRDRGFAIARRGERIDL